MNILKQKLQAFTPKMDTNLNLKPTPQTHPTQRRNFSFNKYIFFGDIMMYYVYL